jgi:allantoinase
MPTSLWCVAIPIRAAASGNNFVSWSPYDGLLLPLRPVATFLRGACVAAEGRVHADPGRGRFVRPALAPR